MAQTNVILKDTAIEEVEELANLGSKNSVKEKQRVELTKPNTYTSTEKSVNLQSNHSKDQENTDAQLECSIVFQRAMNYQIKRKKEKRLF